MDVIDETLKFFKANVFFSSFEMKGDADRLLVYLTLYAHQCVIRMSKVGCAPSLCPCLLGMATMSPPCLGASLPVVSFAGRGGHVNVWGMCLVADAVQLQGQRPICLLPAGDRELLGASPAWLFYVDSGASLAIAPPCLPSLWVFLMLFHTSTSSCRPTRPSHCRPSTASSPQSAIKVTLPRYAARLPSAATATRVGLAPPLTVQTAPPPCRRAACVRPAGAAGAWLASGRHLH